MSKEGYVYIMTNKNKTTLYIGVTNDLCRRIYEHKNHLIKNSFTDKYNLEYCIYFEEFSYIGSAIQREKELKKWNRQKKEDLINRKNPKWEVLVTECGFIRNVVPFSQQVAAVLSTMTNEIPHSVRNDANSLDYANRHSERSEESLDYANRHSERSEESLDYANRHSERSEESLF